MPARKDGAQLQLSFTKGLKRELMPYEPEEEWSKALAVLRAWFEQTGRSPKAHLVASCCEDEDQVREWVVPIHSSQLSLTLARTPAGVMIQAFCPVMEVPGAEKQKELFMRLLRLNSTTLSGSAFGIEDGIVMLQGDRFMRNTGVSDLNDLIGSMARVLYLGETAEADVAETYKELFYALNS